MAECKTGMVKRNLNRPGLKSYLFFWLKDKLPDRFDSNGFRVYPACPESVAFPALLWLTLDALFSPRGSPVTSFRGLLREEEGLLERNGGINARCNRSESNVYFCFITSPQKRSNKRRITVNTYLTLSVLSLPKVPRWKSRNKSCKIVKSKQHHMKVLLCSFHLSFEWSHTRVKGTTTLFIDSMFDCMWEWKG